MVLHRQERGQTASVGRPHRRWKFWQIVLLTLAAIATGVVLYVGRSVQQIVSDIQIDRRNQESLAPEAVPAPVKADGRVNILAMGLDDDALRSDAMLLISIDTLQHRIGVMQIPRDTRALLAGKGTYEKINGAYAYGVGDDSFPADLRALKTVENLVGVPVHHTVVIELDGFRRIVDDVGGVTVDIPFAMDYDDPDQQLSIHFEPGSQTLTGQQALEFVRWRKNNDGSGYMDGDLGRIRTQQQFMKTLLTQLFRLSNLPMLPSQAVAVAKHVETTLDGKEIANLALVAAKVKPENIEFATLPGTDAYLMDPQYGNRLSYYLHDPEQTQALVGKLFTTTDGR